MHRLLSFFPVLIALLIAPMAFAQLDCMGVDGGPALPGTPCDDGNSYTSEEVWTQDCECKGVCWDWDLTMGGPGDPCDDANPYTEADHLNNICICAGLCIPESECDCYNVSGGSALPGTPCDDGNPATVSYWTSNCYCMPYGNLINGTIYLDMDQNGIFDGTDFPIMNRIVQLSPGYFTSSASTGAFSFVVPAGTYDLSATPGQFDQQSTPNIQVQPAGTQNVLSGYALAMTSTSVEADLAVNLASDSPRPGFNNMISIPCKNEGSLLTGGILTFTFDPQQNYASGSPGVDVQGNTLSWVIPEMQLGEIRTYFATLNTPVAVPLGTVLNYSVSIVANDLDANAANDMAMITETVVGSYDPNDKRVIPTTLTPNELIDGKPVEYTIRFQNTGTYLAETVRIEDQLSEDLDLSTFLFLGSSHPCTWSIENEMLQFYFEEIMLPDSNANEPESHGFVMFRITPDSDLQLGDAVENTASIYFDFNEPIITDPAVFVVETSTGVADRMNDRLQIWPNPATDLLNVQLEDRANVTSVELIDITGRTLMAVRPTASIGRIDVSDLPIGNYMIRITSADGAFHGRFVKR